MKKLMNGSMKQKIVNFSKRQLPIALSLYVGWKFYSYSINMKETHNKLIQIKNNPKDIKLEKVLKKEEKENKPEEKLKNKKEEKINNKEEKVPKDIMKMFSEQYIKKFLKDINQEENKINITLLTKESKIDEKDFILAFVLSPQFNDEFIKKTSEFLNKIKKEEKRDIKIHFKLITKLDDIKDLQKITKRKFLLEDGFFNFFSVFNSNLKKVVGIKPSDVLINNEKLVNKFKKFILIDSKNDFYDELENLKTDELVLFLNEEDKDGKLENFRDFVYDNDSLNLDSIRIFQFSENCEIDFLKKNYLQVIINSKDTDDFDLEINSKKFKIFNFKNDFKNKDDLNNKIASELEKKTIFRNIFFNGKRKKYSVDIIIDNNVFPKEYITYLQKNIKLVKQELKENSKLFDFSLIRKNIPNSQDTKLIIKCTDTEAHRKKIEMMTSNKDLQKFKNFKKENPDLYSSFSTSYIYPYETYTKENILEFCNSILKKEKKFDHFSQKEFKIKKYSKKITGKNFKENILDNDLNQVIFYYSKNCSSCKRFLPIYENIFKDYLSDLENKPFFNRMDNDENHSPFKPYYLSTPKIVLYRKDFKEIPFVYNNKRFTKELFLNFLDVSLLYSFVEEKGFWDFVKGRSFEAIKTEEIFV